MAGVTPFLEDEKEGEMDFDINRLSSQDRQAILRRVTPDTSVPTDASNMFQNDIRREVMRIPSRFWPTTDLSEICISF